MYERVHSLAQGSELYAMHERPGLSRQAAGSLKQIHACFEQVSPSSDEAKMWREAESSRLTAEYQLLLMIALCLSLKQYLCTPEL